MDEFLPVLGYFAALALSICLWRLIKNRKKKR